MELTQKETRRPLEQNRGASHWNRIEVPDMNPHNYTHLIFDKGAKNIQWSKDNLQQMLLGKGVTQLQETETRSMSITLY
jgi:hypothetical protein